MIDKSEDILRQKIVSKFEMLIKMTGKVQGMIVAGPPGIGKSYGIENELKKQGRNIEIVKSGLSPIGLYVKLRETRAKKFTLVIDDSDDILFKREGIDLLKAAFDTNSPRRVQWNKQNKTLEKMGIPNQFDYDGQIIFITNINLRNASSKNRQMDYDTLISRVKYLDLEMDGLDARLMRCQMVLEQGMLSDMPIEERGMLFEYMKKYQNSFNEISIRTYIHLVDCKNTFVDDWEEIAANTLMKNPPSDAKEKFIADGSGVAMIQAGLAIHGDEEEPVFKYTNLFGDEILIDKQAPELASDKHKKLIERITIIDDYFKTNNEQLSPSDAEELHDFILKLASFSDEISIDNLDQVVTYYKASGKQGALAFMVSKGVSFNAINKE